MSLGYAYYADDNKKTEEGITVREWRDIYHKEYPKNGPPTDYAGYTYDAVWMYAYALDTLLKEKKAYGANFHNDATFT